MKRNFTAIAIALLAATAFANAQDDANKTSAVSLQQSLQAKGMQEVAHGLYEKRSGDKVELAATSLSGMHSILNEMRNERAKLAI
jgi:hypothetical protein